MMARRFIAAWVCMCGLAAKAVWLPEVPEEAIAELGSLSGKPQLNGFVFIEGRYIPPPYTVTRKGNGIFINRIQVDQPLPWISGTADGKTAPSSAAPAAPDADGGFAEVTPAAEASAETPIGVPDEAQTGTPVEVPAEIPVDAPFEVPAEVPAQVPPKSAADNANDKFFDDLFAGNENSATAPVVQPPAPVVQPPEPSVQVVEEPEPDDADDDQFDDLFGDIGKPNAKGTFPRKAKGTGGTFSARSPTFNAPHPASNAQRPAPSAQPPASTTQRLTPNAQAIAKPVEKPVEVPRNTQAAEGSPAQLKLDKTAWVDRLEKLRQGYEDGLSRGEVFFFGPHKRVNGNYGSARTMMGVLPQALRQAQSPQELLLRLQQGGVFFIDIGICGELYRHKTAFPLLESRLRRIKNDEARKAKEAQRRNEARRW